MGVRNCFSRVCVYMCVCVCVGGGFTIYELGKFMERGRVGVHSLNLGQFSKTHAFFTRYWIPYFWLQSTSKPEIKSWRTNRNTMWTECIWWNLCLKFGFHWHDGRDGGWKWLMQGSLLYGCITWCAEHYFVYQKSLISLTGREWNHLVLCLYNLRIYEQSGKNPRKMGI